MLLGKTKRATTHPGLRPHGSELMGADPKCHCESPTKWETPRVGVCTQPHRDSWLGANRAPLSISDPQAPGLGSGPTRGAAQLLPAVPRGALLTALSL